MQDDECPMLRLEPDERPFDQVAIGEPVVDVAADRFVDRPDLDLDRPSATPPSLIEAGIHEESVEPGIEPVRITKPGQVSPGANQGVLDRVARELRVPEDEARGRVQSG